MPQPDTELKAKLLHLFAPLHDDALTQTAITFELDDASAVLMSSIPTSRFDECMLLRAHAATELGETLSTLDIGLGIATVVSSREDSCSTCEAKVARYFAEAQHAQDTLHISVPFDDDHNGWHRAVLPALSIRAQGNVVTVTKHAPTAISALQILEAFWKEPKTHTSPTTSTDALVLRDTPSRTQHAAIVEEALQAFASHADLKKVVLARKSEIADIDVDTDLLLQDLCAREPKAQLFFRKSFKRSCVAATPEWLYRRRERLVLVDALAGTFSNGASPIDESENADRAFSSSKERLEHELVVDYICSRLQTVAHEVTADKTPRTRRLSQVSHLHTPVRARLVESRPLLSLLHPTPAVCGTPVEKARTFLREREPFRRGQYSGVVGVMRLNHDDCAVALRYAEFDHEKRTAALFAGGGLVEGAVAEQEWNELERKAHVLKQAIAGARRGDA